MARHVTQECSIYLWLIVDVGGLQPYIRCHNKTSDKKINFEVSLEDIRYWQGRFSFHKIFSLSLVVRTQLIFLKGAFQTICNIKIYEAFLVWVSLTTNVPYDPSIVTIGKHYLCTHVLHNSSGGSIWMGRFLTGFRGVWSVSGRSELNN